jgi:sec-independent protein translocase protein TatA
MFPEIGIGKILLILIVVLLLFGAKRVPEVGSSLGRSIREFKRSLNELQNEVHTAGVDDSRDARPDSARADASRPDRATVPRSDEDDSEPKRLLT